MLPKRDQLLVKPWIKPMSTRSLLLALALTLVVGCTKQAVWSAGQTSVGQPQTGDSAQSAAGKAGLASDPDSHFADLEDRGDLVAYSGHVTRHQGAYTWNRADVSEAHAIQAISSGILRVTTPAGRVLDFHYDRHIEHPSGDWTWIGHLPGQPGLQTVLTFGARAAFGSIAQPDAPPLRMTTRGGVAWLVETDPDRGSRLPHGASKRDYLLVPDSALSALPTRRDPAFAEAHHHVAASNALAAGTTTVDLLVGYTPGFVTANGGDSAAMTRLNYLVDVANIAYANGGIDASLRLVKAMLVNYTDSNSNDLALQEMTGYDSDSQSEVPPDPAFDGLRAAREQYGADVVSLVRDFQTPEHEGCGIAWLLGGGLGGLDGIQLSEAFGYSVISDGVDLDEGDSNNYYCLDETLAHELGHNMGAAHDTETAKGDDGVLDNPDDYGAFSYSFGYKTSASGNNFYTIMAYGDGDQVLYRTFSSPDLTICGGAPCGDSSANNVQTLTKSIPVVAEFRESAVGVGGVRADFNGDGVSDLLWRHASTGDNEIWRSANSAIPQSMATVANSLWKVVGVGDFDADGQADVLWRKFDTGANIIWKSANIATTQGANGAAKLIWIVAGVGDFDGEGTDDILWRNTTTGSNVIWLSARNNQPQAVAAVTNQSWTVAGVGDFNHDSKADILWRNQSSGAGVIWFSGNKSTQQAITAVTNMNWRVNGIGDFNGDGIDDIFWRNASAGKNTIWLSGNSGTQRAVAGFDGSFKVAQIGDFNGDGVADVVWRRSTTGSNLMWPSADAGLQQTLTSLADQGWQVQPQVY